LCAGDGAISATLVKIANPPCYATNFRFGRDAFIETSYTTGNRHVCVIKNVTSTTQLSSLACPDGAPMISRSLILALALLAPLSATAQKVRFIGTGMVDGTGSDLSGLPSALLEDGISPMNGLNGFGSALAYTGAGNRYLMLADRGPNKVEFKGGEAVDNTTSYPNRYQTFDITVVQDTARATGWRVDMKHVGTTLLKNPAGEQFLGISTAFGARGKLNRRLDPEGVRIAPDGTVWVSDEYGPYILQFDQSGREIGELEAPDGFTIAQPAANAKIEMGSNKIGRVTNRGGEGLAITPDGRYLAMAMQSPLIQDGGLKGLNTRIIVYDLNDKAAKPRQFIYPLDDTKMAISEILAIDDARFLVDERDGAVGEAGRKLLYLVDIGQSPAATELTSADYVGTSGKILPNAGLPQNVVALRKILFADIGDLLNAAEKDGKHPYANSRGLPDKIEGYAWGPDLPNGERLLLASNDNDFDNLRTGFPNYVFAFAVPTANVPGFVANRLDEGVRFGP
jgi:hypothetical protein